MCKKTTWDNMLQKTIIKEYKQIMKIYSKNEPYYSITRSNVISLISKELKIKRYFVDKVLDNVK